MDNDSPRPLEMFSRFIHPDNERLIQSRLEQFRPLTFTKVMRLEGQARRLRRRLRRDGYNDLWRSHDELTARITALYEQWQQTCLPRLAKEINQLRSDRREIQQRLNALKPLHDKYGELIIRLEKHQAIVRREEEEAKNQKALRLEVKYINALIMETFKNAKGCHHIWEDRRGRKRMDLPHFDQVHIMADAIWFKLASARKTPFGWKKQLPYGVSVADLIDPKTVETMSVIVGRQVEIRRNQTNTAIWYRVNRPDRPGGLPDFITYREMMQYYPDEDWEKLPYPGGVKEGKKNLWLNFADYPHLLVAGETQSGKSNFVNCIIATLVQLHAPSELQIVLIDNKGGVEFTHFREVPHLLGSVARFIDQVLPTLQQIVDLLYTRLHVLEAVKAKNIASYNKIAEHKMNRVVVFVDELAALLNKGQLTKDIHNCLALIAAMGRAVGVHLVLCTQYPNKTVVPTELKANLVIRVTGALPSGSASMTVVDSHAAAKDIEPIPGRMLIKTSAVPDLVQTPFISDNDIAEAVAVANDHLSESEWASPATSNGHAPANTTNPNTPSLPIVSIPLLDMPRPAPIPPAPHMRPFTEDDLIRVAIDDLDGNLGYAPIFNYIKNDYNISRSEVEKMVKEVIRFQEIEYQNEIYRPVKVGRGYHLKRIDEIPER